MPSPVFAHPYVGPIIFSGIAEQGLAQLTVRMAVNQPGSDWQEQRDTHINSVVRA